MVVKVLSKFDLRRLCRVTGATALARLGPPMPEEMGFCDIVETVEIGGDRVTVFRQGGVKNDSLYDELHKLFDDNLTVYKCMNSYNNYDIDLLLQKMRRQKQQQSLFVALLKIN